MSLCDPFELRDRNFDRAFIRTATFEQNFHASYRGSIVITRTTLIAYIGRHVFNDNDLSTSAPYDTHMTCMEGPVAVVAGFLY